MFLIACKLGVIVDSKLSFSDYITEMINKAYSILGIIRPKRNFQQVDKVAFVLLYKALVLSHLKYGSGEGSEESD